MNLATEGSTGIAYRTSDQAHYPRWTVKSVSDPAARREIKLPAVPRAPRTSAKGRKAPVDRRLVVEVRWLRRSHYPSQQTVAQQPDDADAEKDERGGFGGGRNLPQFHCLCPQS